MTTIFKDSSLFFHNFLDRYNILLDNNYDKIIDLYQNINEIENINIIYGDYKIYFDVFTNFYFLKNKIYIVYYILILYLINDDLLKKFSRYIISIFSRFNYINNDLKTIEITKMKKDNLLILLKNILNNNSDSNKDIITKFFLFILCFQTYF
jgi:hypothetical protein